MVAIDDALCLIAFGLASAFAKVLSGKVSGGLADMIVSPLWELLGPLLLGSAVVYEIIGPFCTKMAITKAGEVGGAVSATSE